MMKKNKIVSAGLAGLFCAVTLAGCGGAASSEAASSEAVSSEAVSSEAASSEVVSSEAASSEAVSSEAASSEASSSEAASSDAASSAAAEAALPGNVLYLTGTVSDASMNGFTLTQDDGTTTQIIIADDCVKELTDGLGEGLEVAVGGTSEDGGATLTAMYLTDGIEGVNDAVYGTVAFLSGTVSDAMMNGFTLNLEDGTDVQVTQRDDTQMNLANGMSDGLTVGVAGVLGEQGDFVAVRVTDDEHAVSEYAHEMQAYVGTLQNCMMNSFSLIQPDGTSLDFVKSDACLVEMDGGLTDGADVYVQGYEADGTLTAVDVAGIE